VASTVPVTRQSRLLVGVAITGSIPLTLGAIFWIVGTVMGAAYHGHWSRTAGIGEALVVIGLICGLIMFVFAAAGERWTPREPWDQSGDSGQHLMPLASPEEQAFLADPPRPDDEMPLSAPMHPSTPLMHPPGAQMQPPGPPVQPAPGMSPPVVMPPGQAPPDWSPQRNWFDPAEGEPPAYPRNP
jgi:hypothetical protein